MKDNILKFLNNYTSIPIWLTAVVALFGSFWQTYTVTRHQKLSVRPMITFGQGYNRDKDFSGVFIQNDGIGTAIIKEFKIFLNEKQVSNWEPMLSKFDKKMRGSVIYAQLANNGNSPIMVGDCIPIFGLDVTSKFFSLPMQESFYKQLKKVGIKIKYCSMYDECEVILVGKVPDT